MISCDFSDLPDAHLLKKALLPASERAEAFDELIATGEAIFQVINNSEIEMEIKTTLYRLEKHFFFYAWLLS